MISRCVPGGRLCDPFGGIGSVGSYFKQRGYSIWCGDQLTFAHYFQIARVETNRSPSFRRLRRELNFRSTAQITELLNRLGPEVGWFVRQYAEKRRFFTHRNATRIEACRNLIESWSRRGWVNETERAVLVASLINSMDKVANTAGTYYAYLKSWYRKANNSFRFELIPTTVSNTECRSFLCEATDLVRKGTFDVLYLDPPYNDRCYSTYYHLPETIALGGTPRIHGKAGIPASARMVSTFNKATEAPKALVALLGQARFRLLVLHYSDDGLDQFTTSPEDPEGFWKSV